MAEPRLTYSHYRLAKETVETSLQRCMLDAVEREDWVMASQVALVLLAERITQGLLYVAEWGSGK